MDNRRSREFVFLLSTDRLAGASFERFDDCSPADAVDLEQHCKRAQHAGVSRWLNDESR
jgi:hypothetical protein